HQFAKELNGSALTLCTISASQILQ
ncbi:MAG: hypothetical protein OGMRLDGQ_001852, partial [Candidatus Fervidibacter sp.]